MVTPSGNVVTFTLGSVPEVVDAGLKVTSSDANLTGATLTISSGTLQSGDVLSFTNDFGITGTYSGGVLTLSGTASVTAYQSALDSVLFSTTSTNSTPRSISVVAIDGSTDSTPAAETVDVVVPPTLKASGTVNTFSIGGTPVPVDKGLTVQRRHRRFDRRHGDDHSSALQTGDTLNFTSQNGISGSYSGGVLTLTGSATVAQYQTALDSISFSSTSSSTTTRAISVAVSRARSKATRWTKASTSPFASHRDLLGQNQYFRPGWLGRGRRLGRDGRSRGHRANRRAP